MNYNEPIEIKHIIDPALNDKNNKITFNGTEVPLDEFRKLLPSTESKYNMLVYWDDMLQYTAVGLVDVICEELNRKFYFDLVEFVNRDDYPLGIDYVKKIIFPDLSSSYIDEIYERRYVDIIERSPTTDLYNKIFKLKPMMSVISVVFRFRFDGIDEFVESLKNDGYVKINIINYTVIKNEVEAKKHFIEMNPRIIVCADMGFYYHLILQNNYYNKMIISTLLHNGVNKYILALYANQFMDSPSGGPNKCDLLFLNEEGYRDEDRPDED